MKATNFSDEDRERLAKPYEGKMYGPEEWQECPEHPGMWESHRWVWDVGEGPEYSDAEGVQWCEHPGHEVD